MSNHRAQNQDEMEILGYTFGEIRRAQQGGRLGRPVDSNAPPDQDLIRHRDSDLLRAKDFAPGQKWISYSGAMVEVLSIDDNDWVQYRDGSGVVREKDVFSFQCRYSLATVADGGCEQ